MNSVTEKSPPSAPGDNDGQNHPRFSLKGPFDLLIIQMGREGDIGGN